MLQSVPPSPTRRHRRWVCAAVLAALVLGCRGQKETQAPSPLENPALPGLQAHATLVERLELEREAKGPAYRPRTRHLTADGRPRFTNRLILETSPYLLQHAHNPVSWFPWSDAAFERAAREDKPVLLSIGYSTCHWCHVMERESFEDEEIARLINERFIAVKVDREERPDVDGLYMTAVQMLRGSGGWPMTLVLTPQREPFFAATYIPARDGDRGAPQGFLTVLRQLADSYASERDAVVAHAGQLSSRIAQAMEPPPPAGVPGAEAMDAAVAQLTAGFDAEHGGFGRAPKFPQPSILELLLRHHRRTGSASSLSMVTRTLDAMAAGGIRDHVGGGFHRYATDRAWQVPHFEKMLYDNAQLAVVYLDAFQATGRAAYADIVREILYYVAREMTSPQGAFYSATDADSLSPQGHEEEGRFFTWTPAELVETLGEDDAALIASHYGVRQAGNLEGRSVLSIQKPPAQPASPDGIHPDETETRLARARARLYLQRAKRPAPLLDDKVLASWNGLMISAMARASFVLAEPEHLERASAAADFVLTEMRDGDGRLAHVHAGGRAGQPAVLDDYAFLIQALLDLFEASGRARWLQEAVGLQRVLDQHYGDEAGGYFLVAADHEALLARAKPTFDGAEPSGNAVAALNLLRLAELTLDDAYRENAARVLGAFGQPLRRSPAGLSKMLSALDFSLGPVREVVVVQAHGDAGAQDLLGVLRQTYLPNRVYVLVQLGQADQRLEALVPLVREKLAIDGRATAYVCERGRCQRPAQDAGLLASQLLSDVPR
ncbi:MAG TPA: thioredoxin domain-containing protein [Candidatus Limnocylindrales bacterium]|nr:thioredoxin domain-containing protein [Candidatus Limnocylindrales bacterium]